MRKRMLAGLFFGIALMTGCRDTVEGLESFQEETVIERPSETEETERIVLSGNAQEPVVTVPDDERVFESGSVLPGAVHESPEKDGSVAAEKDQKQQEVTKSEEIPAADEKREETTITVPTSTSVSQETPKIRQEVIPKESHPEESTEDVSVPVETVRPPVTETPETMESEASEETVGSTVAETEGQKEAPSSPYDHPFDLSVIVADCIREGQALELIYDPSLTKSNASWWNPVTASESTQGEVLKRRLTDYIQFHTRENLMLFGLDTIEKFNIVTETREDGSHLIYFLFV